MNYEHGFKQVAALKVMTFNKKTKDGSETLSVFRNSEFVFSAIDTSFVKRKDRASTGRV